MWLLVRSMGPIVRSIVRSTVRSVAWSLTMSAIRLMVRSV